MSNNIGIGSAIVIVGVLFTHLLSLEYEVSFPSVILWIVGGLAVIGFMVGIVATLGSLASILGEVPKKRKSRK